MKPNILLLHGALGSSSEFDKLTKFLSEKFTVHTLNFDGHGSSLIDLPFSIDLFTQNVIDYLNKKSIVEIDIFGFSMGGYVAMNLALNHPKLIGRILTLGTKFDWSIESAEREVKMLNPTKIEEKIPAFAKYLQALHQSNDWKLIMEKTAQLMLNLASGEKLNDTDFNNLDHKIMLCLGSKDKMVSMTETKHVAQQLKNSQLMLIDTFDHPISMIDHKVLSSIIADYFI